MYLESFNFQGGGIYIYIHIQHTEHTLRNDIKRISHTQGDLIKFPRASDYMGIVINLFLLFFWLFVTAIATKTYDENGTIGDIANTTKTPPPPAAAAASESRTAHFKPGIAVTVGIFTTIFSITFLLLLYVKHCKRGYSYSSSSRNNRQLSRKNSGVDRKVIESLPIFRFSSLRGQKDGLECAVCINRFEPDDILRLLPKCKHAFHVECVDIWLEAHSTCPLCRYRVDPEDVLLVDGKVLYNYRDNHVTPRNSDREKRKGKGIESTNARVSGRHSSAGEASGSLEIIVENPADDSLRGRISLDSWNSRRKRGAGNKRRDFMRCRSLDSWKSKINGDEPGRTAGIQGRRSRSMSRKDGELSLQGDRHRLEHRIIISAGAAEEKGEGRRRWSDVDPADLLYLGSEMIIGGKEGEGSGNGVINGRSVSELTGVSRYRSGNNGGGREGRERREGEGVVKRWLAWVSQSQQSTAVNSAVAAASSSSSSIVV